MNIFRAIMSVISTDDQTFTPFNFDKNHTVYYKGDGLTRLDAGYVKAFLKATVILQMKTIVMFKYHRSAIQIL